MAFSFIFNEFLENYKKIKDKEKIKDVVILDENYFLQNLYNNFFGFKIKPYISINKSLGNLNHKIKFKFSLNFSDRKWVFINDNILGRYNVYK